MPVDRIDAAERAILVEDEGRVRQRVVDEGQRVHRHLADGVLDAAPHALVEPEPVLGEDLGVEDAEKVP
jgi:hypothetical protein